MLYKIRNIGNTCYFNAAMQMFFNLKEFNKEVKNSDTSNRFLINYKQFLVNNNNKYIYNIFKLFKCKNEQMDSNELFLQMLESIEEEEFIKKSFILGESKITNWINYEHIKTNFIGKEILHYPNYLIINNWDNKTLAYTIKIKEVNYSVKILLCFIGNDNSGHYFVIVKKKNKWYKIDDDSITIMDNEQFKVSMKILKLITMIYKKN